MRKKPDSYNKRLYTFVIVCRRLGRSEYIDSRMTAEKKCPECGERIKGRADKKFCSDQCRISYNNKLNSNQTNYVRNINNILRRNRRILVELNTTGKSQVTRAKLSNKGFDFGYHTNVYITKEGSQYKFCYEQGYLEMDSDRFLLVVKKGV